MKERVKLLKGDRFFTHNLNIYVNRRAETFKLSFHTHDFVEISYVEEGVGYHYVDDQVLPTKRGDLFLIPVGTPHVFRPTSQNQDKPLVVYNCIFRSDVLESCRQLLPAASELMTFIYSPSEAPRRWLQFEDRHDRFRSILNNMYTEFLQKAPGYESVLLASLVHLLILLHRLDRWAESECVTSNKMDDAIHFIQSHFWQPITVKEVADYSYMSSSHFQRLFKKATGMTFTQYLQNLRIQKCCELLKSTNQSVQQIANQVGYQDMKFFHSLFRKKTGYTPQQYRKRFRLATSKPVAESNIQ